MAQAKSNYARNLAQDATSPEVKLRRSIEDGKMSGLKDAGQAAFTRQLAADNAKRGASPDCGLADEGGLGWLLGQVETSDEAMTTLDLSLNAEGPHQQFGWLSLPKRVAAVEQIAAGSNLVHLLLDSLSLSIAVAAPLATAVRHHARLERLSLERNRRVIVTR